MWNKSNSNLVDLGGLLRLILEGSMCATVLDPGRHDHVRPLSQALSSEPRSHVDDLPALSDHTITYCVGEIRTPHSATYGLVLIDMAVLARRPSPL